MARFEAGDGRTRDVLAHGRHQRITAPAIGVPDLAEMPIEPTGLDEAGQRPLVELRNPTTGQVLLAKDGVAEPRRHEHPADAKGRRERLADRSQRDDVAGGEALEG